MPKSRAISHSGCCEFLFFTEICTLRELTFFFVASSETQWDQLVTIGCRTDS